MVPASDLFEGTLLGVEAADVNGVIFLNDSHDDDRNLTQNNTRSNIECNMDVTGSSDSVAKYENNVAVEETVDLGINKGDRGP